MLSWSLAQCGLTRSHGVSQRCFISVAVLKWQSDPGSQAGLGFRPEVSWRIWRIAPQMLMHFPCLRPHSSPVLLFPLYPGDYPWFASVCAKLTLGIFNSIYYDHICWSFFLLSFPLYLMSPLISCGDRLRISWVIYCHSSKRTHILGTAGLLCFQKTLLCQTTSIQAKVKVNVLTSGVSLLHLLNNGSHHTQLSHFLESFQFRCFVFFLLQSIEHCIQGHS